jgi:transposase-like protein
MASRYTDQDKARVYATLAANGGNVKRTSRETGVAEQTVRDWKKKAEREGGLPEAVEAALPAVIEDISNDIERVRNKALNALEEAIDRRELKGRDLTVAIGVLTDKHRLLTGQTTSRTERTSGEATESREEIREAFRGLALGMVEAAERRAATIATNVAEDVIEVEAVEQPEQGLRLLPSAQEV